MDVPQHVRARAHVFVCHFDGGEEARREGAVSHASSLGRRRCGWNTHCRAFLRWSAEDAGSTSHVGRRTKRICLLEQLLWSTRRTRASMAWRLRRFHARASSSHRSRMRKRSRPRPRGCDGCPSPPPSTPIPRIPPRPRVVPASPPHDLLGRRGDRFRTNGRLPAVLSSSSGRGGHVGGTSLLGRPQPVLVRIPKVVCRHGRDPLSSHRTTCVRDVIRKQTRRRGRKTIQVAHRHCTGRKRKETSKR